MIYPGSSLRQSTVIANQPLVNTTEIVTPTSRLNRKIYHTPAIIQTVVDTPLDSHQLQHTQVHEPRIVSYNQTNPIALTASPFGAIVHNAVASTVRPYNEGLGVKVHEDLSHLKTFDQETSHYVKQERIRQKGLCSGFLNCVWGNNCSLWMCCLIPLLCLLLIFGISYCVNKQNNIFNSTNFSTETSSVSVSSNTKNIPQIINPIVSTDQYHPVVQSQQNTTVVENNKNQPYVTNTNNFSNQQQQYLNNTSQLNPSFNSVPINNRTQTVTSNYEDNSNSISQVNNTSTISNTIDNQLQAPTIQQLQTKAMIEAQRYKRQMSNTTGLFHLRHHIQ